ncbi:unnamed protein product [Musa acuminata subsp. malaccensis]|uniref:Methionyl-tRNA formyltransferase, mitochondrial n=1 Tax=Musa acuminata subsp. malaccensis TaxID=214687 RepID=A0A804L6M5_MUSAM|nr:PREDICTED: uncharacterized protein LOC103972783 [Musa acuminata subsp. malaccensis]XP_009385422.1 PREDICTED: uncharacterized protein LOC103972783 [Musa acuminata subsp. malaccensis]XP_018676662.1 PREDICTED: uncharacterized protein LOC103972783 [Musa acuminata subsp. malaccensis]CAG1864193.1 unnamed protein product [Musa acuminata subsp. malaccensis]
MLPPPLSLRRFCCCCSALEAAAAAAATVTTTKRNLVFLGSPQVSASVLDALLDSSQAPNSIFQLAAIVTQPPSGRGRGRKLMPSPVAQHAIDRGFPQDRILTPERAGEETFLSDLRALNPELCVTAAYGNILPNKFLEIPPCGTVNIHPSLLPLYRGAAPVQRALQDGIAETGVSLAYTVRELDSGPVIAYERVVVDDIIKAPELLATLFNIGSTILLRKLPSIFDGTARLKAQPQDHTKATMAPKLSNDESWLSFDQEAKVIHNKVRAFAGWPGTRAKFQVIDMNGHPNVLEIKIITTRVSDASGSKESRDEITFVGSALLVPCAGHSWLEILELQPPGKKAMSACDFWNGLRGQKLKLL